MPAIVSSESLSIDLNPAPTTPGSPTNPNTPKKTPDPSYMHRPPRIVPNYGKKKRNGPLPKSSISRVLLYDNVTQQQMLDVKLGYLHTEQRKAGRLMDMHKK